MGRGLIHQEQIRRIHQQAREREAGLFAAGEHGDLLEDVVLAEEECAEDGARLLLGQVVGGGAQLHDVLHHGEVELQVVGAVLGEVPRENVAAELTDTALDRDDVAEDLEQGGLAGAVGSDEHDALAALGLEVEVAVDDVVAVRLLDVLEGDDLEAGAG